MTELADAVRERPGRRGLDGGLLLARARSAVRSSLGLVDAPLPAPAPDEPLAAVFVTIRRSTGELHGCIGTVEPTLPLSVAVEKYARFAAFEDPRSRRLTADEIDRVAFEVSVLSSPTPFPCEGEEDACRRLRPGVDGVILTAGGRRGLFLPQVWESLPEPREFLRHLHQKAGLPPRWDPRTTLERFTVESFHEPSFREPGPDRGTR